MQSIPGMHGIQKKVFDERGISLVELIVAIGLFSLVMAAVTGMLISSMRTQQKVDAEFRSQLDVGQALSDIKNIIAEAKRRDVYGNQPYMQDDLISFPTQNGSSWVTYVYGTTPGANGPTIVRIITSVRPTLPIVLSSADKQMISVKAEGPITTVDRVDGAPIFTYFGEGGGQITPDPVTKNIATPRNVRSILVSFKATVSGGHDVEQPSTSTLQINLRNY